MHRLILRAALLLAVLTLAACGGGGVGTSDDVGASGPDPEQPAGMAFSVPRESAVANGMDSVTLTVNVTRRGGGRVADGTMLTFTTDRGDLSAPTAVTVGGAATVTLTSATTGAATVTAEVPTDAAPISQSVSVSFTAAPPQPATAVVRIGTVGPLPPGTMIGSIDAVLLYPPDRGISITGAGVIASGYGATAQTMLVANPDQAGRVNLGLVNLEGIAAGEFATLIFNIAGPPPEPSDFSIGMVGSAVSSCAAEPLANQVVIRGVTIQ